MTEGEPSPGATLPTWKAAPIEFKIRELDTVRRWISLAAWFGLTVGGYLVYVAAISRLIGS